MRAGRDDLATATPSHHGGPPRERGAPSLARRYFRPSGEGFDRSQSTGPEAVKPFPDRPPEQLIDSPNILWY